MYKYIHKGELVHIHPWSVGEESEVVQGEVEATGLSKRFLEQFSGELY